MAATKDGVRTIFRKEVKVFKEIFLRGLTNSIC